MGENQGGDARDGIVADGRERYGETREYREAAGEIRARYRALYREKSSGLSPLGRLRLRVQIWRRVRREIDELAPPGANYVLSSRDSPE